MDAEVWPDPRVVRFVNENFIAARAHVKQDPQAFRQYAERYKAPWTPAILLLDSNGVEHHRIEGFLPADDLLAQLMLGRARLAFDEQQWAEAERRFKEIVAQLPNTDTAAEALYWAGVAPYKATGNPASLKATGDAFKTRYRDTPWAKKASVWT
ncbi:MAG TPA: thioredoxin fold domain-containing protein [Gemmatimonadales bacterium]|nr:thioredoxin fold domain-containing protein [Gemmatimonadales bacterium]